MLDVLISLLSVWSFFFFKQKTAYERGISDWSSDVCSSDLPEFELPIPVGPNLVTPRGKRLRGEAVARLEAAVAAEPDEAARKKIQRQLRYFGTRKATAEVRMPADDGVAGIGSRVRYALNGTPRAVTIVGHDEADPAAGRIAFSAPLGRALMGAEAGDLVAFQGREDAITVLAAAPDAGEIGRAHV